jgi:F0F1-type ATP synthase assembly protein I
MQFQGRKSWIIYFLIFALIGLLLAVCLRIFSLHFSEGFLEGYLVVFIVDIFLAIRVFCLRSYGPGSFLKKFFRAEMQKIVLFVLLIAFVLRYSRPDFFGLLLGLIFALIIGRSLSMLLDAGLAKSFNEK